MFLLVGVMGFIPALVTHPAGMAMHNVTVHANHGYLLGLFPVNAAHNVVHLLFGLWGLAAARSWRGALIYARSVAIIFFLLAIAGLLPGVQTGFGLLPLYAKDVWLHGLIALGGLYFGWAARGADRV